MRRGSTLVMVLLISLVLLLLGLGFLSKRSSQYAGARAVEDAARARALALAGLEGARARLSRDLAFPPPGDVDQLVFEYSENVFDRDGVTPVGAYVVRVDSTYAGEPTWLLRIRSTGLVGSAEHPRARRQLTAEVDLSPTVRGGTAVNPSFFKIINWVDQGSY